MNIRKDKSSSGTRAEIKAFLGEGTDFKGILTFEGTVRVDGKLEGQIVTKDTLIVGESAVVNAEINVHTVIISGIVRGNINATGKIEVHRTGKLFGNIKTPSLFIEEGVIFEGGCSMVQGDPKVSSIGKRMEPPESRIEPMAPKREPEEDREERAKAGKND